MISTSAMSGTFDSTYSPSASSVAAISFSTEFLAPGTTTSAAQRARTVHDDLLVGFVRGGGDGRRHGPPVWPRYCSACSGPTCSGTARRPTASRATPASARRPPVESCGRGPPTRRRRPAPRATASSPRRRRRRARADRFAQAEGPFTSYERSVQVDGDQVVDTTDYRLVVPWFGWLFRWPIRCGAAPPLGRRRHSSRAWAPPDRLTAHHVRVARPAGRGVADAPRSSTRCSPRRPTSPPKDFGISEGGQSIAGVIVRVRHRDRAAVHGAGRPRRAGGG